MQLSSCVYFSFELSEMSAQVLMSSSLGMMEEETKLVQKQGLVTILSSDCERNRASSSSSLRRTLSADISSKKWLSQNGFFSPMKKTVPSQKLSHSAADSCYSSESDSSDDGQERKDLEAESIWSAIQKDKSEKPGAFDIWSSIVSQKTNEDASKSSLPPPYIHPLVKRSQSSLSEKSLEICTESLGSETGSDGFSSYPSSETGETEEDKDDEEEEEEEETEKETIQQEHADPEEDFVVPKFYYSATSKKAGPRSFPPPLPSLTRQDGPSVHMRPRRENGRLVLEAVSVPSQNNFCAKRQDGRLLLTFNNLATNEEFQHDEESDEEEYDVDVEEMEEEFGEFEKDDDEEESEDEEDDDEEREEEEIDKSETEQAPILSSSVYSLGITMSKPIGFVNRNPKWSEKLNEVVNSEDVKVAEKSTTAAKSSLPPRPRVVRLVPSLAPAVANSSAAAAVSSVNRYEYFWRAKSTNHPQNNSPVKNNNSSKRTVSEAIDQTPQEQQKLMVLKGKNGDCLVQKWSSCKETRRSLLFWEPRCIATS